MGGARYQPPQACGDDSSILHIVTLLNNVDMNGVNRLNIVRVQLYFSY